MSIGELIEEKKAQTGLSDDDFGKLCGLSKQTVHRLRHGSVATALTLGRLSHVLGVPYRVLAEMNEEEEGEETDEVSLQDRD